MARTKQTARRSTGGKAPRKQLAVFVSSRSDCEDNSLILHRNKIRFETNKDRSINVKDVTHWRSLW